MRKPYTLNGAESTKLFLQVSLVGIVTETCDNERLEGITSDIGVLVGLVCKEIVSNCTSSRKTKLNTHR
jgi:hypothetical protein